MILTEAKNSTLRTGLHAYAAGLHCHYGRAWLQLTTSRCVLRCLERAEIVFEIVFEVLSGFAQQWNAINWHESQNAARAWTDLHRTTLLGGRSIIRPVARRFFIQFVGMLYCNDLQRLPWGDSFT